MISEGEIDVRNLTQDQLLNALDKYLSKQYNSSLQDKISEKKEGKYGRLF